jgi:DNA-binding NarL/FixJ family response regulator
MVKAAERLQPDVIVADISMPLLSGIEAARQIRKGGLRPKIVFLTMHPDVTYAVQALEAGGSGFVVKHSAPEELVVAIREALLGHLYVTPLVAKDLLQAYRSGSHRETSPGKLSPRQREILHLLCEGRAAKEIATILNVSHRTVEFHKYRLMGQLGLHSTAELVQYAIKHGIISA